jgi:omega-6 fatty acid desaturase (delta-12 desaturase)
MTAASPRQRATGKAPAPTASAAPRAAAAARAPVAGSAMAPAPLAPPPFTKEALRLAIPAHCFERSAATSLYYAARDVAMYAALAWAAAAGIPLVPHAGARAALWAAYAYAAGCVLTGWWMIGHECGHGAFSASPALNFVVGTLAHTSLGVPYAAWRITHARHHKHTNSMEDDEPFVPFSRDEVFAKAALGLLHDSPALRAVYIAAHLLFGWPLYLLIDLGGPAKNHAAAGARWWAAPNHFLPTSALFERGQRAEVAFGTAVYVAYLAALYALGAAYGWGALFRLYGAPLLVVNAHLVTITYLQHTDAAVPHYRGEEFTWLRGALATVDRSWGPTRDALFHHISNTHVAHHLFHDLPFYHAKEATVALRKALGDYYMKDDTPIGRALWRSFTACKFVDDAGVAFFKPHSAL